jgi:hypothetical protein
LGRPSDVHANQSGERIGSPRGRLLLRYDWTILSWMFQCPDYGHARWPGSSRSTLYAIKFQIQNTSGLLEHNGETAR